jgi:hypothetical protein
MKNQERDLISKYLSQWISKENLERHNSMIQSKIITAEKIEKTYLALHTGIA